MLRVSQLSGCSGFSYFQDNFNDNSLNTNLWTKTESFFAGQDNAVTAVETSGAVTITPINSAGSHYNGYEAGKAYNFSDGASMSISIVPSGATKDNEEARFGLLLDTSNYLSFAVFGTTPVVAFRIRTAGSNSETNVSYNSATHKYLQFVRSGTDILFQTSSDALTWTTRRTVTPSFSLAALKPAFFAGTFAAVTSPITYTFDDFKSRLK